MNSVLFVCTANRCRSPVAAALLRRHLVIASSWRAVCDTQPAPQADAAWRIQSAGTWAQSGLPLDRTMARVTGEQRLDLGQHCARRIEDVQPLQQFRLILTMEQGQKEALRIEFPAAARRIYLLSEMVGLVYDIPDPTGKPMAEYRITLAQLDRLIAEGFPRIVRLSGGCEVTRVN